MDLFAKRFVVCAGRLFLEPAASTMEAFMSKFKPPSSKEKRPADSRENNKSQELRLRSKTDKGVAAQVDRGSSMPSSTVTIRHEEVIMIFSSLSIDPPAASGMRRQCYKVKVRCAEK
ncbi:hypothetical protein BaRGS_00001114, partial [Batillaria attramentaria]